MHNLLVVLIGTAAGTLSGLVGIGGGVVMVPAMVMVLGFSQHLAQGTSLTAMLPPISILAVIEYYKNGYVDIPVAIILAVSFIVGGFLGGKISIGIDDLVLKRIFGFVMLFFAVKMLLAK